MESSEEIPIKQELVAEEEILLNEKDLLEEDVPEYVNINLFSDKENGVKKSKYTSFKCDQCPEKYRLLECLKIHTAYHTRGTSCPLCNEVFSLRTMFRKHLKKHIKAVNEQAREEERNKTYSCAYCPKTFTRNKPFVIHTRVHTNERPYKCEICGEGFKQSGPLKAHYITHTRERPFICEICNGSYTTSSSLRRHKRRIHDKGRVLKCGMCDATMFNMADFKNHRMNAHLVSGYVRKCPMCPEVLYSRYKFNEHRRLEHNDEILKVRETGYVYSCTLCDEVFSTLISYAEHRRMHVGYTKEEMAAANAANSFECKICFKILKTRANLYRHMEFHTEKRFTCNICNNGKYYRYSSLCVHIRMDHAKLKRHLGSHKKDTNRRALREKHCHARRSRGKKFSCRICREQYSVKYKLNLHVLLVHGQKRVKNYKCLHCEKRFSFVNTLASHLAKCHRTSLKYKCFSCTLKFTSHKELVKHKRSHKEVKANNTEVRKRQSQQDKPSRCSSCKKIFWLRCNYETHLKFKSCIKFINDVRRKSNLERNATLHNRAKFECKYCQKLYASKKSLRKHIRLNHPKEEGFHTFSEMILHTKMESLKQIKNAENPVATSECSVTNFDCGRIKTEALEIKEEPSELES